MRFGFVGSLVWYKGGEVMMRAMQRLAEHGFAVTVLDDERCVALMTDFIAARPELWFEDIGQVVP